MKLNQRQKYRLFWIGVGSGTILLIVATLLMQVTGLRHHLPLFYGTEPYSPDPASDMICRN